MSMGRIANPTCSHRGLTPHVLTGGSNTEGGDHPDLVMSPISHILSDDRLAINSPSPLP